MAYIKASMVLSLQVVVAECSKDFVIGQATTSMRHSCGNVLFEIDGVTKISGSENQQPVLLYPHP
jgi:hypothetical protein